MASADEIINFIGQAQERATEALGLANTGAEQASEVSASLGATGVEDRATIANSLSEKLREAQGIAEGLKSALEEAAGLAHQVKGGLQHRGSSRLTAATGSGSGSSSASQAGARKPRNHHLAGQTHPTTGVPFDKDGYPDFSKWRHPDVNDVRIVLTGSRSKDFAEANRLAGLSSTPEGYTWHHHQDPGLMVLVETTVHRKTGHTGGFSNGTKL